MTTFGTDQTSHFNIDTIISGVTKPYFIVSIVVPSLIYTLYWIWTSETVVVLIKAAVSALVFLVIAISVNHLFQKTFKSNPKVWDNDVVIITGGSSGIGLLLTKTLAAKGAKIAIFDIQQPLEQLQSDKVQFYQCDITNHDLVQRLVDQVEHDLGPISVLVNNAGIVFAKSLEQLTPQQIRKTFEVNTLAQFWTVKAVLPKFKERRQGHIVTVASTMGLAGVADMTDYCASKHAAIGFHHSLRQEIKRLPFKHLIHTSLLCPGLILTGMFDGITIAYPFLIPPLTPQQVVDVAVNSLENTVSVKSVKDHTFTFADKLKLHKVVWFPFSYILPPLLDICLPVYLTDLIKATLGANSAITEKFKGRNQK